MSLATRQLITEYNAWCIRTGHGLDAPVVAEAVRLPRSRRQRRQVEVRAALARRHNARRRHTMRWSGMCLYATRPGAVLRITVPERG